jgi:hypothetical protein
MKTHCNQIIIGIVALLVIAGGVIFYACKKDNNIEKSEITKTSKSVMVENDIIYKLSEETGININELSEKQYVVETVSASLRTCAGIPNPWGAGICAVVAAAAGYAYAYYSINNTYEITVENCRLKYGEK